MHRWTLAAKDRRLLAVIVDPEVTGTPQELHIKLRPTGIEKLALEFGAIEQPQAMEAAAFQFGDHRHRDRTCLT